MNWYALQLGLIVGLILVNGEQYNIGVIVDPGLYQVGFNKIAELARKDVSDMSTDSYNINLVLLNKTTISSIYRTVCNAISNNTVVLISVCDSSITSVMGEVVSLHHMPMLSIGATDPHLVSPLRPYLLSLSPSDKYQAGAIFSILKYYNWIEFSVISSEDDYGIHGVTELLQLLSFTSTDLKFAVRAIQYFTDAPGSIEAAVGVITNSLSPIIVMICHSYQGKILLDIAQSKGLLDPGHVWILADGIIRDPDKGRVRRGYPSAYNGLLGVLPSFQKTQSYNDFVDRYLRDESGSLDDVTTETMLMYDAIHLTARAVTEKSSSFRTRSIPCPSEDKWDEGDEMLAKLQVMNISGTTGENVSTMNPFVKYDIINFKDNVYQTIGYWKDNEIFIETAPIFLGETKLAPSALVSTLFGKKLTVGIVEEAPLAIKVKTANCTRKYHDPNCWLGVFPELNQQLARDLNFTLVYHEPEDEKYGGFDEENERWNGMIGDLILGKIDIIGTAIAINIERKNVISFTYSLTDSAVSSVVIGASTHEDRYFFLKPFHEHVWAAMIGLMAIITAFIALFNKLSPYGHHGQMIYALQTCQCEECTDRRAKVKRGEYSSLKMRQYNCKLETLKKKSKLYSLTSYDASFMIGAGFVFQGTDKFPHSVSGRFLLFAWWFFVMIVISMYTANLTAFITLNRASVPIKSIKGLLEQSDYNWGYILDRNVHSRLLNHVDSTYHKIVEKGVSLANLEDAKKRVLEGKFVFIDEDLVLSYHFQEFCDKVDIPSNFHGSEWAYGIQINSPYRKVLNQKFLEYSQAEYFSSLWSKWNKKEGAKCPAGSIGNDTPFFLTSLSGLFLTLVAAMTTCFVILILELIHTSYRDSKRDKLSWVTAVWRRLRLKWEDICREWLRSEDDINVVKYKQRKKKSKKYNVGKLLHSVGENDP